MLGTSSKRDWKTDGCGTSPSRLIPTSRCHRHLTRTPEPRNLFVRKPQTDTLPPPSSYWVEIVSFNSTEQTANETSTDTGSYRMNHTMLRVKDKDISLNFYQDVMGMNLKRTSENASAGFNLYFLGYGPVPSSSDTVNGVNPTAHKEGLLELTWNYGTEKQEGKVYHDGNSEPQGFGHICVSVDDLDAACKRFEEKGVSWKKRLTDGRMKNVAFVLDPDGYWIEVIQNEK